MPNEPSSVAELDTGEAPLVLALATTNSSTSGVYQRTSSEIFVRRQVWSKDAKVLVIIERSTSEGIVNESHRYLDLLQDFVLPIYAIPRPNRTEWNVEVAYGKGTVRVDYPFRTRADAFRFQQLLTGYKPVEVYEDITCVVTYKGWKLPQPQYVGSGGIQLWVDSEQNSTTSPALSRSGQSSHGSTQPSIASIQRTSTLVQRHAEKSVLVVQNPRPPLVVAFLKDKANDEGYTMLKMNSMLDLTQFPDCTDTVPVTHLLQCDVISQREEALLRVISGLSRESTFRVDKHLPSKGPVRLSSWNLCERRQSSKDKSLIKPLDCTHLAVNFGSCKDPLNLTKRASLDKAMLRLRAGHMERLSKLSSFRDNEIAQRSQEMRTRPSSMVSSVVPSRSTNLVLDTLVLPVYQQQPWISTTFISAPWGSPDFGKGAVTSELDATSPVSQCTAISPSLDRNAVSPTFELGNTSPQRSRVEASRRALLVEELSRAQWT
ncbi:hypothetical protein DL771_003211 [Monosporascus sp. 5C6A]|nr:hypothetical protein DL771_003211 [Monosporascus sp. 5C6A]